MAMMRAAWYEKQGLAADVLKIGELPLPQPSPGEVRVRIFTSGIHVGDVGKRRGYWGSSMAFPRVIPHGDGAGVIDAVGKGVPDTRIGERVWVFLAQSYRPGGTAADYTVVPSGHAVSLPGTLSFDQAAAIGIPGITGHRAVFVGGAVSGKNILVTGATGAVGRAAVASALRAGAKVIASVRPEELTTAARELGAHHVILGGPGLAGRVGEILGKDSLDLATDVAFDSNIDELLEALAYGGSISTYATGESNPKIPYWPLGFKNITIHFLSNDDFPEDANQHAARDLTEALIEGTLRYPVRAKYPLEQIVTAHETVEHARGAGRVLLQIQPAGSDESADAEAITGPPTP